MKKRAKFILMAAVLITTAGVAATNEIRSYLLEADALVESALAVSGLTATPDPDGLKVVDLSFKTPAVKLSSITIVRDGEPVKTINNPQSSTSMTFVDENVPNGSHTYTVTSYDAAGNSASAETSCFIGVNRPAVVTGVSVRESNKPQEVIISWNAVDKDIDGKDLPQAYLTYEIYSKDDWGDYSLVAKEIKSTSYTCEVNPGFVNYCVVAHNDEGLSDYSEVFYTYVGEGADMPYKESGTHDHDMFIVSEDPYFTWGIADYYNDRLVSIDNDDRFFSFKTSEYGEDVVPGACDAIMLDKINISSADAALSFYVYRHEGNANELRVYVISEGKKVLLETVKIDELTIVKDWNRVILPLANYNGKSIIPVFEGLCNNAPMVALDCIEVLPLFDYNLSATHIAVPKRVVAGNKFTVSARIENNGLKPVKGWKAQLLYNDKLADEVDGIELGAGQVALAEFDCTLSVASPEKNEYSVRVVCEDDKNPADNTSETVPVILDMPLHPVAAGLIANSYETTVTLSWTAPDPTDTFADPITDDVESYQSFAENGVGGWTMVDADKGPMAGFYDREIPGIANDTPHSFFVFDSSHEVFNDEFHESFEAHSGSKYFAAMYNSDYSAVDDWLISPLLAGCAQTVTLWLRSYDYSYLEEAEILFTESTPENIEAYKLIGKVTDIPQEEWSMLSFDLPEGATHFAVRCTSPMGYMLLVDDITYRPAGKGAPLEIKGYNIYRDGVKINDTPISSTTFNDTVMQEGEYSYAISTVYDKGESKLSQPVTVVVTKSGLSEVVSECLIKVEGNHVSILADADIEIFSIDGKCLISGNGSLSTTLSTGLYIVKIGGTSRKIMVK